MTAYAYSTTDVTGVVGRRIGAWVIDLIIYLIISTAVTFAFGGNGSKQYDLTNSPQSSSQFCSAWRTTHAGGICFPLDSGTQKTAFTIESSALPFIVVFGHMALYALVQGLLGASIGKLMVGLRVVDSNGEPCGVGKSFIRTFLWVVDGIIFTLPIVGGALMVSTKGHRRVGDMAAGTFVVDKGQVGHPVYVPGLVGNPPQPGLGSSPYPPQPGAWGQPGPGGYAPPADQGFAQPAGAPSDDGPHWDPIRETYIQFDRPMSAWLEWDDATKTWKPIST